MVLLPACAAAAPPLTSVAAVRALSYKQAAEGRLVDLHGIVVYYDRAQQDMFFQDATAPIYVAAVRDFSVVAGSRVEIRGIARPGYTNEIEPTEIREISRGPLPTPTLVTYAQAARHENDCRFVTMEGIVRSSTLQSVAQVRVHLLELDVDGQIVDAAISNDTNFDPAQLVDATVRVTGNLSGNYDPRDQILGLQFVANDANQVVLVKPAARQVRQIPVISVDALVRSDNAVRPPERIRTNGVLTLYDPGERIVIEDGDNTLLIYTRQMAPLVIGQRVEVTGFPAAINGSAALKLGQAFALQVVTPLPARNISFADAMSGQHSNQLVALEGEVVSETREGHLDTLTLRSGERVFQAVYRKRSGDPDPVPLFQLGTKVRVQGVCMVHVRGFWGAVESFQVHIRSERDISILALPSWWTVSHMLLVTLGLLGVVLLVLGWGVWVRRRLSVQETLLRQKIEMEAARLETQARLERQRSHILELINSFEPLPTVFAAIHGYVAEMWPGVTAYSHVLQNRQLSLVSGAHLGEGDIARLQLVDPTYSPEPCALAVRTRSPVSHPEQRLLWSQVFISSRGEILGTMTFEAGREAPVSFNQNTVAFWCNLAAIAIDNRRLYEAALHRSEHDQLTGLPNRVLVDARLEEALNHARRTDGSVALLFLDLDDFKAVNDNHSHRIGDLYLCQVANGFQGCLRDGDLLGRIGGDEFIVVIADRVTPFLASEVADRLRRTLHGGVVVEGIPIHGSVSIGVAISQDERESASELKHQADAAMYAAKRAGGDRVSLFEANTASV